MANSSDSRHVATGAQDGTVLIWGMAASLQNNTIELRCPSGDTNSSVTSLQFSPDGDLLAATQESGIFIWHVSDGSLITSVNPGLPVLSCLWRRDTQRQLSELSVLGTARDGSFFLSVTTTEKHHTPTTSRPTSDHGGSIPGMCSRNVDLPCLGIGYRSYAAVVRSYSGRFIAAFADEACMMWRRIGDTADSDYEFHELSYAGFFDTVIQDRTCAAKFFGSGEELLVAVSQNGTILWWDLSSFPISKLEPCGLLSLRPFFNSCLVINVVVSPLSSYLVVECYENMYNKTSSHIAILRSTNRMPGAPGVLGHGFSLQVVLHGHTFGVHAMHVSPCERYIALACNDGTIPLWDIRDGSIAWTFRDHDAPVTHLEFSPDMVSLISGDSHGKICIRHLSMYIRT